MLETPQVHVPRIRPPARPVPPRERPAYFPECSGFAATAVHARDHLGPGQELEGPAIVEERESPTVLPPGVPALVDEYGSLHVLSPSPPEGEGRGGGE